MQKPICDTETAFNETAAYGQGYGLHQTLYIHWTWLSRTIFVAIGRRREKRWVALFTCMTTRHIHLELSTFVAKEEFQKELEAIKEQTSTESEKIWFDWWISVVDAIAMESGGCGFDWVFNTPGNPAAGGTWEHLARSVRRILALTLKEKVPQVGTLQGLLKEADNLINSFDTYSDRFIWRWSTHS